MMRHLLTLLLIVGIVIFVAEGRPNEQLLKRLRTIDANQPLPRNVADAKALHADLLSRARTIERMHGHRHATLAPAPFPASMYTAPTATSSATTFSASSSVALSASTTSSVKVPTIFPTDFGADPTGNQDSTSAFAAAVAALLKGGAPHHMAEGITDLGGATLDLAGGEYLISAPIVIPMYFGNLLITSGSLRASPSFPSNKWLIMVGDRSCNPPSGQGSCNEFVNIADVFFDCAHTAAGGFYIAHAMGATIGPAFIYGFNKTGIQIDGGHEVMMTDTWLAEYYWSERAPTNSSSIGIQVNGNDHYLTNIIVFAYTNIGVEINGAANILSGVHTWNGGGQGIIINSYQTRLIGCYLDYDTLVLKDPEQTVVENTFFLGTNTVLRAVSGKIDTLLMRFNTYTGGASIVVQGNFSKATGVSIAEEINGNKFTRVKATLSQKASTAWTFDFSSKLLFPWIDYVSYSVATADGSIVSSVAQAPKGTSVTILTGTAVDATVSIEVAQAL